MSGISFIKSASGSTNFKTKICLILMIFMLFERSSLYIISSRIVKILKGPSLAKSNLLLSFVV